MAKYYISEQKLKEAWEAPPCRDNFKIGDSYCAEGKLMLLMGQPPSQLDTLNFTSNTDYSFDVQAINDVVRQRYGCRLAHMNDDMSANTLRDNHRKALGLGLQIGVELGLFEIEQTPYTNEIQARLTSNQLTTT